MQSGLGEPVIKNDAVTTEVGLHLFDVLGQSELNESRLAVNCFHFEQLIAVYSDVFLGTLDYISAMVAVFGEGNSLFALKVLQISRFERFCELLYLIARVVYQEFAGNVVACCIESGCKSIADSAAASVAHVHGACGVGGNELYHYLLTLAVIGPAVVFAFFEDAGDYLGEPQIGHEKVDESGTCYLSAAEMGAAQIEVGNYRLSDSSGSLSESSRA